MSGSSCQDDDSGGAAAGKCNKQSVKFDLLLSESDRSKSTLDGFTLVISQMTPVSLYIELTTCHACAVQLQSCMYVYASAQCNERTPAHTRSAINHQRPAMRAQCDERTRAHTCMYALPPAPPP